MSQVYSFWGSEQMVFFFFFKWLYLFLLLSISLIEWVSHSPEAGRCHRYPSPSSWVSYMWWRWFCEADSVQRSSTQNLIEITQFVFMNPLMKVQELSLLKTFGAAEREKCFSLVTWEFLLIQKLLKIEL